MSQEVNGSDFARRVAEALKVDMPRAVLDELGSKARAYVEREIAKLVHVDADGRDQPGEEEVGADGR